MVNVVESKDFERPEGYYVAAWSSTLAAAQRKASKLGSTLIVHEPENAMTLERYLVILCHTDES